MSDPTLLLISPCTEVAEQIGMAAPHNCKFTWLTRSQEALEYLTAMPAALVLADQRLPDQSGTDLLEEIGRITPSVVRLLILDADENTRVAVEAVNRARAAWILQKPLHDLTRTETILKQALDMHKRNAQGQAALETLQVVMQGKTVGPDPRAHQIERLCTAGEMAGSLIHKFNNSMTIILGHLELLQEERQDPDLKVQLRPIFQSASDSVKIARRIQSFLRTGPEEETQINVNDLLVETLEMTEPLWRSGPRRQNPQIRITTGFRQIPTVAGNSSELREVFTNLILNAVDAMPHGGKLTLSTYSADRWVRIEISDTGQGMPDDVQQHIFEPFFTTKGKDGNGLGLSIVRRIVREHGGEIRVESHPDRGTRFILMLPIKLSQRNNTPPHRNTISKISPKVALDLAN